MVSEGFRSSPTFAFLGSKTALLGYVAHIAALSSPSFSFHETSLWLVICNDRRIMSDRRCPYTEGLRRRLRDKLTESQARYNQRQDGESREDYARALKAFSAIILRKQLPEDTREDR